MTLDHATLIFLVLVFVAAEIYRLRRGQPAIIVSVGESSFGPVPLPVMQVDVRLSGGAQVSASLDCCTACLGRLKVGDEVRVYRAREGYKVALPWIRSGTAATCESQCGSSYEQARVKESPPPWWGARTESS
jgi:hypothetical protein